MAARTAARPPIIRVANGTFYRHHPSSFSATRSAAEAAGSAPSGTARENPPLFSNLTFELPSDAAHGGGAGRGPLSPHNWCIVGPSLSGKTTLLQALRGQHVCLPPTARSYPYLASDDVPHRLKSASRAIRYVGFDADGGSGGSSLGPATSAYLSARYESRREITDFSLRDFLLGNTELNPYDDGTAGSSHNDDDDRIPPSLLERVVHDLRLAPLMDLPVSFLSNGQGRRARIARALLTRPAVLLLDEPFMGLDPPTVASLSPLLRDMAAKAQPRFILSSRPQDPLPSWISHLIYLRSDCQIGSMGPRDVVLEGLRKYVRGVRSGKRPEDATMPVHALGEMGRILTPSGIEGRGFDEEIINHGAPASAAVPETQTPGAPIQAAEARKPLGEPIVEMQGCRVRYGDRTALGNWTQKAADGSTVPGLIWTVRRGERWGVFGPNGSGKTTIVSLLCSDHPQTYSLPIRLFGRSRLPEPGSPEQPLTFWDIQARVGHSSPEVHQHMPRSLTVRQIVSSAWADTFRSKPKLTAEAPSKVNACLSWFASELNPSTADSGDGDNLWADNYLFGELSFSAQRVLLFIRAVIKNPDIVVLDEAFSGMDESVRDKCSLFLSHGETATYSVSGEIVESDIAQQGAVRVHGLTDQQALICIAHVKEEVPDCVREWMCLPEANTTAAARFGRLAGPLRTDRRRWDEIWAHE